MTDMDTLIVVRDQSHTLIRAEVHSLEARATLEQAVRDAVNKLHCNVDAVSEASGLTPAEIRRILHETPAMGQNEVDVLAGLV